MSVDLSGLHVVVPQQLLNDPDIITVGQHVRGKAMAKRVRSNVLFDLGSIDRTV